MHSLTSCIRAELIKIVTLPGVWVATILVLGLQVLVLVQSMSLLTEAVAGITSEGTIEIFTGLPQPAAAGLLGLMVAGSLQIGLFLPLVAALIAGQEYLTCQLGSTLLAMPDRNQLFLAKTSAAGLYLLCVALLICSISAAFTYVAIESWNPGLLLSHAALLGHAKFIAFALLFSLTGFAMTFIVRSTAGGITLVLSIMMLTLSQLAGQIHPMLDALVPLGAARNLLLDGEINRLSASPRHGLLVLIGWTAVSLLAAWLLLRRRDAR